MRQIGMRYWVDNQTFGILVLSCVLVTIWWVLKGGGLGEPEVRTMRRTHQRVLVKVVEYVMEVVVAEEKSQWWGPHENKGL